MLNSLSKIKTEGVRESFDKKFVQAAIRTKYRIRCKKRESASWETDLAYCHTSFIIILIM